MASKSKSSGDPIDGPLNAGLSSACFLGIITTCLFYAFVPYSPIFATEIQRYFLAHWIEYANTGLFFIAACFLFRQWKQNAVEQVVLKTGLLDGFAVEAGTNAPERASRLEAHFEHAAQHLKDTLYGRRVRALCQFVLQCRSGQSLDSLLKWLSDRDEKRAIENASLIRTITMTIPIIGLLGTLECLASAMTNASQVMPENVLTVAGLGRAFEPLTMSLGLCAILIVGRLFIVQTERQILRRLDGICQQQLTGLILVEDETQNSPFQKAERLASDQLLVHSEKMIQGHMSLWQTSLETLRERWSNALASQQDSIVQSLQNGMSQSLADHSQQLTRTRSDFLTAFTQASESINSQLAETRSSLLEQEQRGMEMIAQTWQQFRSEIVKTRDEHARQLALLTQAIAAEVGGWQNQLQTSTQSMSEQFEELRTQGEVFLKISENESELVRLEKRLAENLEAVRVVESLEFTLMNLNAAVSLLTSRVKSNAA